MHRDKTKLGNDLFKLHKIISFIALKNCRTMATKQKQTSVQKYKQTSRAQLPEIISGRDEWMCDKNITFVVKREVKLDVPEMK